MQKCRFDHLKTSQRQFWSQVYPSNPTKQQADRHEKTLWNREIYHCYKKEYSFSHGNSSVHVSELRSQSSIFK